MADKIKVALVDDHTLFRKGLKSVLETCSGIEVVFDGENGQELLDAHLNIPMDVALIDLEMSVMDGVETCKALAGSAIKTLVISMHKDPEFMSHLMEIGANGYLVKNAEPEELEEAIKTVYSKGYYFNDSVSRAMLEKLHHPKKAVPKLMVHESDLLSERETEILQLICDEFTTAEIADKLFLSPRTVEGHRKQLLLKTGTRNLAGLVRWAIRNDLVRE